MEYNLGKKIEDDLNNNKMKDDLKFGNDKVLSRTRRSRKLIFGMQPHLVPARKTASKMMMTSKKMKMEDDLKNK